MAPHPHARLPKASDLVVQGIRHAVIANRLPVGTRLGSEVDLVETYGVGRVAVREALRLLERDGLVELRRGIQGGIFVANPNIQQVSEVISLLFGVRGTTLREFVEFRQIVEPNAAALAAERIDDEQRVRLERSLDGPDDLAHVPDLHVMVADAAGNGVLSVALNALHHPLGEHFRPAQIQPSHLAATAAAHTKIARRILEGDADGACRAMEVHLEAYRDYLVREGLIDEPIIPVESWAP
ncbi:FadR/GntR family transcriptional regulator [Mariniluteicoccus flavus]